MTRPRPALPPDRSVDGVVTAVVAPGRPFAHTSYARARLLRQLHASGLLAPPRPPSAAPPGAAR